MDKPGKGEIDGTRNRRQAAGLYFCYGTFVFLLLATLTTIDRLSHYNAQKVPGNIPPKILQRVRYIHDLLAPRSPAVEITGFASCYVGEGASRATWVIACDTPQRDSHLIFDRDTGTLVQWSQTTQREKSDDPETWQIKDADAAEQAAYHYLRLLNWERNGSHWKRDQKVRLGRSCWVLFFRQGERHATMRICAWSGDLLLSLQDTKRS